MKLERPVQRMRRTRAAPDALVVGLVNNMPDAALQATERQFRELLAAGAGPRQVEMRLVTLRTVPRGDAARSYLSQQGYRTLAELDDECLDGLIVTGTEPRSARLDEEPYWQELRELIDWAADNTASTVWSCLAAHAAVLAMHGIERVRFPGKLFGVFECAAFAPHRLTDGLSLSRAVPHSRLNDLPQAKLEQHGFEVLARGDAVGADLFVKDVGSLFVLLQGHPEYDRGALMREYRRDVGRYLNAERDNYPSQPHGYFDARSAAAWDAFQLRAGAAERDARLISEMPPLEEALLPQARWRSDAVGLYANWLEILAARRSLEPGALPVVRHALSAREATGGP